MEVKVWMGLLEYAHCFPSTLLCIDKAIQMGRNPDFLQSVITDETPSIHWGQSGEEMADISYNFLNYQNVYDSQVIKGCCHRWKTLRCSCSFRSLLLADHRRETDMDVNSSMVLRRPSSPSLLPPSRLPLWSITTSRP